MYDDMPVKPGLLAPQRESATYTQNLTDELALKVVGATSRQEPAVHHFAELAENLSRSPATTTIKQSSGEAAAQASRTIG